MEVRDSNSWIPSVTCLKWNVVKKKAAILKRRFSFLFEGFESNTQAQCVDSPRPIRRGAHTVSSFICHAFGFGLFFIQNHGPQRARHSEGSSPHFKVTTVESACRPTQLGTCRTRLSEGISKRQQLKKKSAATARLSAQPNGLVVNLMEQPDNRRLRRYLPNDLPARFLV
jgi:hypothetical protein